MENVLFKIGITNSQIEELINYSKTDEVIKKNTNDPKRFKDIQSYNKWIKISKQIYTITNKKNQLLGMVWIRERKLDNKFGMTFGIRLYEKARGKGLSEKFLKWALDEYLKVNNSPKKFWLETNPDNAVAIKLYEKFGFKKLSGPNKNGRIIMIQS